jgi:signal peptidase II
MLGPRLIPLALAAALVLVDQLTKAWVLATIPLGAREATLGLGFHVTHTRNTGAAFGFLRELQLVLGPVLIDGTFVLGLLSLAVSIGLVGYLLANGDRLTSGTRVALALVLAGAAGNMIDRLGRGFVVDFIHFQVGWFDFPVFNAADAAIVIGAVLIVLGTLFGRRPPERAEAGEPTVGNAPDR